jgi:hypothetical protein
MKLALVSALTLGAGWALALGSAKGSDKPAAAPDARMPVLVELFTSEGCSSCPPADAVLARLVESQPVPGAVVIALSEHVDYWNRLGWSDPYSSKLLSERQGAYAASFRNSGLYTPQVVVDGQAELVGSDERGVEREIASASREPKLEVALARGQAASSLRVRVAPSGKPAKGHEADVLLALVEDDLHSQVSRGENSGRRLSHTAVVRRLDVIGRIVDGGAFDKEVPVTFDPAWKLEKLSAVAFVQERPAGRVLGAARGPV